MLGIGITWSSNKLKFANCKQRQKPLKREKVLKSPKINLQKIIPFYKTQAFNSALIFQWLLICWINTVCLFKIQTWKDIYTGTFYISNGCYYKYSCFLTEYFKDAKKKKNRENQFSSWQNVLKCRKQESSFPPFVFV